MGKGPLVVGVDGWREGWVAVVVRSAQVERAEAHEDLVALIAAYSQAEVIGVDMPIGLPAAPPRACDEAARRRLGPRRSSVFPAPPRDVLQAATYAEARAVSTKRYGRSVSAQSYALRHRIFEVDAAATADGRFHEVHPELAFAAMAGRPLGHGKKTWNGMNERRSLLIEQGLHVPERLEGTAAKVPVDDVLDAAAVAWSALRIAAGTAERLPDDAGSRNGEPSIWF